MTSKRLIGALLVCGLPGLRATRCDAQALKFEVASVRQNKSGLPPRGDQPRSVPSLDAGNLFSSVGQGDGTPVSAGHFLGINETLFSYIAFAYKLSGTQILALRFKDFAKGSSEVPGWVMSERYNIEARAEGAPSKDEMRLMVQALLAERFKLTAHHEVRQLPVLALVLVKTGKTGPGLRAHAGACLDDGSDARPASGDGLPPLCGVIAHVAPSETGRSSFGGRGVTLGLLASSLPTQTGMYLLPHPVIDETGLTGTFDLKVEWAPENSNAVAPGVATPAEVAGPTFFEALKEQLGLKVVQKTGPVDVLVLDHIERPTEN